MPYNHLARGLVAVTFLATYAFAQDGAKLEGSKPYTPTRLEWLAVYLNASMHQDATAENDYTMAFAPVPKEDAILIYVTYSPTVNRQRMNMTIETAKQVIAIERKASGWTWLKVKERVEPYESASKSAN